MTVKLHRNQKNKISTEMYLKSIFLFKEKNNQDPRPVDIVKDLKLSKGTVSEMLKKLGNKGFVDYASYNKIKLTKKGLEKAETVVERYLIIKQFLTKVLNVPREEAHDEACNLEHAFSDDSVSRLKEIIK